MAKSSNASPEVFGFDFQINATIFLLLDNIKEVKTVRMEGASEDIELTMNDGNQIMAQAKGVVKGSSDFSHVRSKLSDAIRTLSSADNTSVEQLILITNSKNPLKEDTSKGFFYGPPVAVSFNDLSDDAKKVIDDIVERLDVSLDRDSYLINSITERYDLITKILYDYNSSNYALPIKERTRAFIKDKWKEYISVFSLESLDTEVQEAVTKVILAKVIQQRYLINNISREVSL